MDAEEIQERRDWLAWRRARLDQFKMQFERQYDVARPRTNEKRLEDLEVWQFQIEMAEWELQQLM